MSPHPSVFRRVRRGSSCLAMALLAVALPACQRTTTADSPRPAPAPVRADTDGAVATNADASANTGSVTAPGAASDGPPGAGQPPPVAIVRLRNVGTAPITLMTNPDINEMLHTWRLNVGDDRSDRGLLFVNNPALLTRVKLFPVDLPRCDADAARGFGGLGRTSTVVVAPGETYEIGAWDGMQREEVVDPARGVCLREYPAPPGRYRFHFDNPHNLKPDCQRVLFRVPLESDGGVPVIELRCTPRADGGASN